MIITNADLLSVTNGVIAHGVNARGVMGAGVAKQIRDKWPEVYTKYKDRYHAGYLKLGSVHIVEVEDNLYVANCVTQDKYGRGAERYLDYNALDICLKKLAKIEKDIHFPLIGGGLANGDPEVIKAIMRSHFPDERGTLHLLGPVAE